MEELNNDFDLYCELMQVKKKSQKKQSLAQMSRCENHDVMQESDDDLEHE